MTHKCGIARIHGPTTCDPRLLRPLQQHRRSTQSTLQHIMSVTKLGTSLYCARQSQAVQTARTQHPNTICWFIIIYFLLFVYVLIYSSRSQWPRGLRRRSAAACLLRLWVRIPPGAWMSVCCGCCVLSLRRADHSSGGVLPTVVRRCV